MKRIIASIIAAALFFSFVACSDAGPSGTHQSSNDIATEESELTNNNSVIPIIPLEGYKYRAASVSKNTSFDIWDFDFDEPSSDTVSNALYERNLYVEETYDIDISASVIPMTEIALSINASDDEFDVVFERLGNLAPYISGGYFLDLNDQLYIDLSKSCWDYSSVSDLSICGKAFTATGDIHLSSFDCTWTLYFDYNLMDSLRLEIPYTYVDGNEWTFDVFSNMCKSASMDLNNDNEYDENDQWGFSTHKGTYPAMIVAAGEHFISKGTDDIPFLSMDSEKFADIYEYILDFMHSGNAVYEQISQKGDYGNNDQVDIFLKGNSVFYAEVMNSIQSVLRDKEGDYGVLPWPKYTEEQDRYYNYVHEAAAGLCIPRSSKNPDTVSLITEALAEYSTQTIRHAYYEVSMIDKLSRDDRMEDMLDIIFDNRTYEIAFVYSFGNIRDSFYRKAVTDSRSLSSYITEKRNSVKSDIAEYIIKVQNID